jgi:hypothetical protein
LWRCRYPASSGAPGVPVVSAAAPPGQDERPAVAPALYDGLGEPQVLEVGRVERDHLHVPLSPSMTWWMSLRLQHPGPWHGARGQRETCDPEDTMGAVLNRRMMAVLFLSSYSPLFALLALRTYHKSTPMFDLSCVALIIALLGIATFLLAAALRHAERHRVLSADSRDGDVASYAATYLLPFLGIFGAGWRDVLALALFIGLIGVIYVQSRMIYVNPVLLLLGYRLYSVQTTTAPVGSDPASPPPRWLLCRRSELAPGDSIGVRQLAGETLFSFPGD